KQSSFSINILGWILLTLLLLSILYNILQARKISKLKDNLIKNERVAKVENTVVSQPKAATATKVTTEKAKSIFEASFSNMLSNLNSEYSSACVAMANIEAYKKPMLDELAAQSFNSETEVIDLIRQRIN